MKRKKRNGRPHHTGRVQLFDYGPWRFNINTAMRLAADRSKYRPELRRPTPDWVGPNIDVDSGYAEHADSRQPVLFATVIHNGQPFRLLIDGNHRVTHALREQTEVLAITLDLEDSLKVLTAPPVYLEQMKRDGARLGLLRDPAVP